MPNSGVTVTEIRVMILFSDHLSTEKERVNSVYNVSCDRDATTFQIVSQGTFQ